MINYLHPFWIPPLYFNAVGELTLLYRRWFFLFPKFRFSDQRKTTQWKQVLSLTKKTGSLINQGFPLFLDYSNSSADRLNWLFFPHFSSIYYPYSSKITFIFVPVKIIRAKIEPSFYYFLSLLIDVTIVQKISAKSRIRLL